MDARKGRRRFSSAARTRFGCGAHLSSSRRERFAGRSGMDSSATFTTLGPVVLARFYADSGGKFPERSLLCSCPFRSPYAHPCVRILHRKGRALGVRGVEELLMRGVGAWRWGHFILYIVCITVFCSFVCSNTNIIMPVVM